MPTAKQNAANNFYIDDEGNVQRTPTKGTYGFRGWWERSNDFSGGLPMDYDWKKLDRPKIERAPAGPLYGKKRGQEGYSPSGRANVREPEPRSGVGGSRFGHREAQDMPESEINDPRRAHNLTNIRVSGMTTDPFGEIGDRRGALPRGSQFEGTYIEPQTAIGPGGGNFPDAIEATSR